ncbi:MAG: aspartate carbamoyltransferase regulatory subunit [uncultured bacterium]|nr:MAG: aspartate carbamoyltransferase regulatory subunit [uncultured bacterium]
MNMTSFSHPNKDLRSFKVFTIEEGTVIDHIDAGQALNIIRVLDLAKNDTIVTVGLNLPSKKLGHKDLIKVEFRNLTPEEANKLAIFAPHSSINIIKNYEVTDKFAVTVPPSIKRLIVCPNPSCITQTEHMDTLFHISNGGQHLKFTCHYCEKKFQHDDILEYRYS